MALLVFHPSSIVFAGTLGAVGQHRHAAPAVIFGLERPIAIATDTGVIELDCAFIPPGLRHAPDFGAAPASVLYLQPDSMWAQQICAAYPASVVTGLLAAPSWRRFVSECASLPQARLQDRLKSEIVLLLGPHVHNSHRGLDPRVAAAISGDERAGPKAVLSRSRLRHLFVEQVHVPQRRYKVWVRLQAAVAIALSGQTLTAAAHEAGFTDSAHFSRAFRDMFGLAPSSIFSGGLSFRDLRAT